MEEQIKCPVCSNTGPFLKIEEVNNYEILRCDSCSLEFVGPVQNITGYYDNYYSATPGLKKFEKLSYNDYVKIGRKIFRDVNCQPYNTALRWITENLQPGDMVLDIGCGTGLILASLIVAGFEAVGIEVSEKIVLLLNKKGFKAYRGPLEKVPLNSINPNAVTMFEVIEHIPDPLGMLTLIHQKFPNAPLIISVPTPLSWTVNLGIRSYCDYPPNHLTRWTEKSLKVALKRAGYNSFEFLYPDIPAKEIFGGLLIWLTYKLGLRKKGYFGEIQNRGGKIHRQSVISILTKVFYPLFDTFCSILGFLFLPLGKLISIILNKKGYTSFCSVVIAEGR